MCGVRIGIQVSRREFYIHIYLDYVRVEILFFIQKYIYIYIYIINEFRYYFSTNLIRNIKIIKKIDYFFFLLKVFRIIFKINVFMVSVIFFFLHLMSRNNGNAFDEIFAKIIIPS